MLKNKIRKKVLKFLKKYLIYISKFIDNVEYLHYTDIKFYKLKNFDVFLKLLEDGKIRISFKISFFRSGKRIGQTHDHGTGFDIMAEDIPLLFDYISIP